MGRRQRKRARGGGGPAEVVETTAYSDPEGNVLTLRNTVSAGTARKIRELDSTPAASAEDRWQRRTELLFERFAVGWEIAGLPLGGQKELLGRYRMADGELRRWVRETLDQHVAEHQADLAG
jgi:hypothetical protein